MADRPSPRNPGVAALVLMTAVACSDGSPLSPSDISLRGTQWSLAEIDGTRLTSSAPPTLVFGDDARASGFAGCNQFSATYALEGSNVRLSAMAITRMYCAGTMDLETRYVSALESARSYRATGTRLELLTDRTVLAAFDRR